MIVDASVWVSSLSNREANYQTSRQWLQAQIAAETVLVIPSLALPEIAGAIARRENSTLLGHRAIRWITHAHDLQIVSLHDALAHRAAEIAADYRFRGADAVYVAVAEGLELPLVTWDQELQHRAAAVVDVLEPGDEKM